MTVNLSGMRREYTYSALEEASMDPDPMRQFDAWFKHVERIGLELPNSVVLATAGSDGRPSARYVLIKDYDEKGFVFYSRADSPKGRQLTENPRAALVFYWKPVYRQIRVEGAVEIVSATEAQQYFRTRPYGSRISARLAPQSSEVPGRDFLEQRHAELDREFKGGEVPAPESWTGYRVVPDTLEFWQGRPDRLHDRLVYRRADAGRWTISRLAP